MKKNTQTREKKRLNRAHLSVCLLAVLSLTAAAALAQPSNIDIDDFGAAMGATCNETDFETIDGISSVGRNCNCGTNRREVNNDGNCEWEIDGNYIAAFNLEAPALTAQIDFSENTFPSWEFQLRNGGQLVFDSTDPNALSYDGSAGPFDEITVFGASAGGGSLLTFDRFAVEFSVTGPELSIAENTPAAELETVEVDVELTSNSASVAATTFSVDYDETCLSFDDTDADADNIPDNLAFSVPADFSVTAFHDLGDADGEIDVSITDLAPPIATLPDGALMTVTFTATCEPGAGATIIAPVGFSSDPSATFSDDLAVDVDGTTADGSVEIWAGPRGDCNGNDNITAADLIGDALEIFDGDGSFWADAPGGTFAGSPVGCDANADTAIDAGDISCTILLIFGNTCGGSSLTEPGDLKALAMNAPLLDLKGARRDEDGKLWIPVMFSAGDHDISSLAFSLDLAKGMTFDPFDGDGDGLPDAMRFPGARPDLVDVRYDASDSDGELDLTLATFSDVLAKGLLVEIAVEPLWSATWQRAGQPAGFAEAPGPTFGNVFGQAVSGHELDNSGTR